MKSTSRRLEVVFFFAALIACPALAPRAARAQDASSSGILSTPVGLTSTRSNATPGLVTTDPAAIDKALASVSALDLTAHFKADPGSATRSVGAVTLAGNADVTLHAHVSRSAASASPVIDSFDVAGTGVKFAGITVQHATLDSKGQLTAKLSRWVPSVKVKSVEHKSNGDTVLHTSWWMPNVTVKADGTTKALGIKVGTIDPKALAHWPPALADFMTSPDSSTPNADLDQLAGTLTWSSTGTFTNDTLAIGGTVVSGTATATVQGTAHVAGGRLTTLGDASTAAVSLQVASQNVGAAGARLESGSLQLSGKYQLSVPLQDPGKSLQVNFNGEASYAVEGSHLSVVLPQGSQVAVADIGGSGTSTIAMSEDTAKNSLSVTGDGTYTAHVKGPVQVTNLGPAGSFTADTQATSSGRTTLASDGNLTLEGTATASATVAQDGVVQVLENGMTAKTTVKAGAQASVDASDVKATVRLGLAPQGSGVHEVATGFTGASATGVLKGALGVDGADVEGPGVSATIDGTATASATAPFAASVDSSGKLTLDPAHTSATVPVSIDLQPGTKVTYNGAGLATKFSIDQAGSHVQLTGKVAFDSHGNPKLQELDDADVSLLLGPGSAAAFGHTFSSSAEKTVALKGKVVFRPDGFDVYGTFTVSVHGDDRTPILSVRY